MLCPGCWPILVRKVCSGRVLKDERTSRSSVAWLVGAPVHLDLQKAADPPGPLLADRLVSHPGALRRAHAAPGVGPGTQQPGLSGARLARAGRHLLHPLHHICAGCHRPLAGCAGHARRALAGHHRGCLLSAGWQSAAVTERHRGRSRHPHRGLARLAAPGPRCSLC